MKDIKEIMMEMNNLTKEQLAVELSEEEKTELANLINAHAHKPEQGGGLKPIYGPRPTNAPLCIEPCTDVVSYCCKADIPKTFSADITNRKITAVSCLYCFTDPCPCEVSCTANLGTCQEILTLTVYPVRVIGCIQFVVSASSVGGEAGISSQDNVVIPVKLSVAERLSEISANGSVCVNQIVKFQKFAPTPSQSKPKKIKSEDIQASIIVEVNDCHCSGIQPLTTKVVSFSGQFKIPSECTVEGICPTSAP